MPGSIMQFTLYITDSYQMHTREAYSAMDLLGDLGGVVEVIIGTIGVLLYPISEFSFVFRAIEKLYFAKTKNSKTFKGQKQDLTPFKFQKTPFGENVKMHYKIQLDSIDKLKLYFSSLICCLKCSRRVKVAKKLKEKGEEAIDHDF